MGELLSFAVGRREGMTIRKTEQVRFLTTAVLRAREEREVKKAIPEMWAEFPTNPAEGHHRDTPPRYRMKREKSIRDRSPAQTVGERPGVLVRHA